MRTIARPFDGFGAPISQWLFNGTLADTYGGLTLALSTGTLRYADVTPGVGGITLDGVTLVGRGASDASLRLTGDMTFHALLTPLRPAPTGSSTPIIAMTGPAASGLQADNCQWGIRYSGATPQLEYYHESGAGTLHSYTAPALGFMQRLQLVTFRRSGGVVQFFIDGAPAGAPSAALPAPDGGTSALLLLGQLVDSVRYAGHVGPFQVHDYAMTDAQIAELYNRSIGRVFGMILETP